MVGQVRSIARVEGVVPYANAGTTTPDRNATIGRSRATWSTWRCLGASFAGVVGNLFETVQGRKVDGRFSPTAGFSAGLASRFL